MTEAITPSAVRYIKLGKQGGWLEDCRRRERIALGHDDAPHEAALDGEWGAVAAAIAARGRGQVAARRDAREVHDFYTLDETALWITFDSDHLWWTRAEREVRMNAPGEGPGSRWRAVIGGWRNTDLKGRTLKLTELRAKLELTRNYRRTICRVAAEDYLLRRINGEPEEAVERARAAQRALTAAARDLIAELHPNDLELLVDLIFARSGWRRRSVVGETMKDADLLLEQEATGERAFVQVKSRAGQATLANYIERYRRRGDCTRMFFVCHSPHGAFEQQSPDVHIWTGDALAERAVGAGLANWLIERNH